MKNVITQIRQMQLSDLPEVFSLWKTAGLSIENEAGELVDIQITIKMNPTTCLVLVNDQTIIGAVIGAFNGRRGWIYHLAIHPELQKAGYGSLLLDRAEKELKKKGAHRVQLGVEYTNLKIIPFYDKNGYSVVNNALWLKKDI